MGLAGFRTADEKTAVTDRTGTNQGRMAMTFWRQRWILVNRKIFTAIPFFSAGFGGEELWRGIQQSDVLRILSALSIMVQGLFSSFIFIRNGIVGRGWKGRNLVFFLVGALTGLIIGLTVYYPIAYDSLRLQNIHRQNTTDLQPEEDFGSSFQKTENLNLSSTITPENGGEEEFSIVSKIKFLIPTLLLSILVLVSTIYGLSIKLEHEKRADDENNPDSEEALEAGVLEPLSQKSQDNPSVN